MLACNEDKEMVHVSPSCNDRTEVKRRSCSNVGSELVRCEIRNDWTQLDVLLRICTLCFSNKVLNLNSSWPLKSSIVLFAITNQRDLDLLARSDATRHEASNSILVVLGHAIRSVGQ